LPVELAIELALAITAALTRVHAAGVMHRDLRPAHVLVDLARGHATLVGFAAAVSADEAEAIPAAGRVLGLHVARDDRRTGRGSDMRSDYYSLGAMLYRL
jgi:serine/threonine protein kinase